MTWSRSHYALTWKVIECFRISSDGDWKMLTTVSGTHHSIDMTSLTQLRSIEFMVLVGANQSQWVTQILSQISSANLEDVVFRLDFFHSKDIVDALEWNDVDAALQRSTFSRLRNVYFLSNLPFSVFDSASDCTSILQRLPRCHARGIFRIDPWCCILKLGCARCR
jgi:hypothetical protein